MDDCHIAGLQTFHQFFSELRGRKEGREGGGGEGGREGGREGGGEGGKEGGREGGRRSTITTYTQRHRALTSAGQQSDNGSLATQPVWLEHQFERKWQIQPIMQQSSSKTQVV